MTVKKLIERLQEYPEDQLVTVRGIGDGIYEVDGLYEKSTAQKFASRYQHESEINVVVITGAPTYSSRADLPA